MRSGPASRLVPFEHGFRCFFLSASVYAALSIGAWVLAWEGVMDVPQTLPPSLWHAHEMIFGFAAAALAGFMLTAVPNWTGDAPLSGSALAVLWLMWLLGRIAAWCPPGIPPTLIAAADLLFLPFLGLAVGASIVRKNARRNVVLLAVLALLVGANVAVHAETVGIRTDGANWGVRLAVDLFALLVALIGGRIVPAFTTLGMARAGTPVQIEVLGGLDRLAILSVAILALGEAALPDGAGPGVLAAIACAINAARFAQWKGWATFRVPLVAVLHVGYGWLVAGLCLKALFHFGMVPEMVGMHALSAGAFGTMIAAVMTRAALGHTGRPLVADSWTIAIYALVVLGALLRVLGPLAMGEAETVLAAAAGVLWGAGFALYAVRYAPILLKPRLDPPP
jgi:uncharacterized protein involved in response to NO